MDLEQLEKQRALLGLPSYVEQLRRQQAGESTVTPLEVLGALTRPIESVTAAPARAAIAKLQQAAPLSEVVQAFKAQMGKPPETAPSGEQLAQATGLGGKPAKVAGLGLEMAIDPTNLIGAGVAKAAVPLLGLAGVVNKIKQGEKIAEAASVAAKPSSLGFYSKLEDEILKKMGGSATPEQVMAIAKGAKEEEVATSGLAELLKGKEKVTQEEVLQTIRENRPQLQEVVKGGAKNTLDSTSPYYQIPAVRKIVETEQGAAGIEMALANDGDAYEALMKKFPQLNGKENWEEIVVQDVLAKAQNKQFQPTRFAKYQEPGGKNYREVLLTYKPQPDKAGLAARKEIFDKYQPQIDAAERRSADAPHQWSEEALAADKEADALRAERDAKADAVYRLPEDNPFQSSHWSEENVLAHARVNDRVDEAGNKLFHVEEIQSDWHQAGRKAGYQGASDKALEELYAQRKSLEQKMDELGKNLRSNSPRSGAKAEFDAAKSEWDRLGSEILKIKPKDASSVVPDAPFKKSWMELMAKRMVTQAVESGADRLSWTPGAKQAARYDLSKQVKEIDYIKNSDGTFNLGIVDHQGESIDLPKAIFTPDELPDVVGKEVADKIIKGEGTKYRGREHMTLEGLDLKVGGKGMEGFYDKILPDFLRKFGKKYGAELGETTTNGMKVPYLELTPKLKEAVLKEGVPLFAAGAVALPAVVERMRQQEREKAVGR